MKCIYEKKDKGRNTFMNRKWDETLQKLILRKWIAGSLRHEKNGIIVPSSKLGIDPFEIGMFANPDKVN